MIPTIIRYYVKRIESLSLRNAKVALIKLGFDQIGYGCESYVFSRKGFEWVIKLTYDPHNGNSINTIKKNPSDKHFAIGESFDTTHGDFFIVVQKKLAPNKYEWNDEKFKKWVKMIERKFPTISDLIKENAGMINGRLVCIDWVDNS
jgi:hypothetical protein